MLNERLQILVTSDQRRRLEAEARRLGTSVASLIREAVDARFGRVAPADKERALQGIKAMNGRFLPPEELERLIGEEREGVISLDADPDGK